MRTGLFSMMQWYIVDVRSITFTVISNGRSLTIFSHTKINAMCT
ncbi:hypothetical protein AB6A23_25080 [Paenibacillus tarimensis]